MVLDQSLAEKAKEKEPQCLSCMKLKKDEEPDAPEWEPAVRTIRIDLPRTYDKKTDKVECASAATTGEICGRCFHIIHTAPKGENPGF